jgi:predicted transcriptional regulator
VLAEEIRNIVDVDPGRSMRSIATEFGVTESTMRQIVQEDLRYKSYAMWKGQFMSEATKTRRAEKARKLLARLKQSSVTNQLIFFSDKKTSPRTRK